MTIFRSSLPEMFCNKGVLRNFAKFTGKHLFQSLFFNKLARLRPVTFLKKESLAQVFSCKFCEVSKNTFFYRIPSAAASVYYNENIMTPLRVFPSKFFKHITTATYHRLYTQILLVKNVVLVPLFLNLTKFYIFLLSFHC